MYTNYKMVAVHLYILYDYFSPFKQYKIVAARS